MLRSFATGGSFDAAIGVPTVHVDGLDRVSYPLCKEQTSTLVSISTPVCDPERRHGESTAPPSTTDDNIWQIDESLVHVDPIWLVDSLPRLVADCCAKLGINSAEINVRATLNKLLVLQEGGLYNHRARESFSDTLGCLIVQLPAHFSGGHLLVDQGGQTKRFQFSTQSADKAFYVAFSAGCECALEPITSGRRLLLIFDLVRGLSITPGVLAPAPPNNAAAFDPSCDLEDRLQKAVTTWCKDEDGVQKFVLPLGGK